MFEPVEIGSKVSKDEFEAAVDPLRLDLINAQYELHERPFSVIVLVAGDDRLGVEEAVDVLHEWMDARYLDTHVFRQGVEDRIERPWFWQHWQGLPRHGQIGVHMGGWIYHAIARRLRGVIDDDELDRRLAHIRRFEELLAADGTLILKFWMHLSRKDHRKRLEEAEEDPDKGWRMEDRDWKLVEHYREILPIAERTVRETDTPAARWHLIESADRRHRHLTFGRTILEALTARLEAPEPTPELAAAPASPAEQTDVLASVDLTAELPYEEYRKRRNKRQVQLSKATRAARDEGLSTVLVFEGWDAAGKGGVIRRLTHAMSAADYRVVPIAAPTEEELAHHYLWRFWRHLPRLGRMVIFDRSWYGRVLVERVEEYAHPSQWQRGYTEINDFEQQIVEHGTVLLKFWLHIDPDEQERRFKQREVTPYKKYKITDDDYRNRSRWAEYTAAVDEMVRRTGSTQAPWKIIAANDKRWARVEVLKTVCKALEKRL
ncbi:MAG: polyphosphate:AMP phosphotransferase [Planctomycetes bacterium]|nr:polyphosphate:AMP phosphotransferase [Planctomycetota bacterium]